MRTNVEGMTTTALAPWYGSNRILASHVGEELAGCSWVGIAFGGGMCELSHIPARTLVVNDLHRHVINLASVAAHPTLGPKLYRALRRLPFHPETFSMPASSFAITTIPSSASFIPSGGRGCAAHRLTARRQRS